MQNDAVGKIIIFIKLFHLKTKFRNDVPRSITITYFKDTYLNNSHKL